jgi:hypothetical protein
MKYPEICCNFRDLTYELQYLFLVLNLENFLDYPVSNAVQLTMEMYRCIGIGYPEFKLVSDLERGLCIRNLHDAMLGMQRGQA